MVHIQGLHSQGHIAKVKPAIEELMQKYVFSSPLLLFLRPILFFITNLGITLPPIWTLIIRAFSSSL